MLSSGSWGAGMQRREFLGVLGGVAAARSIAARAQQPTLPIIGYLNIGGQPGSGGLPNATSLAGFRAGLNEFGYVEGRNFAVEMRGTEKYEELPALASDLVRLKPAVIVAAPTVNSIKAVMAATTTIPIVFAMGSDPVKQGLVESLSRPGRNATGVSFFTTTLAAKRVELMRELVPNVDTIGVLFNPSLLEGQDNVAEMQAAARSIGQEILLLNAGTEAEINAAFASAADRQVGAMLVDGDALFRNLRGQIAGLAERHRIPTSYANREYVAAGGLMSYGDDRVESWRQVGRYVGRILKGDRPSDLPVLQPTKFELVINLRAAKALGITFPLSFQVKANEVIE
jgi:putative ABC transport system substrate-binding protein